MSDKYSTVCKLAICDGIDPVMDSEAIVRTFSCFIKPNWVGMLEDRPFSDMAMDSVLVHSPIWEGIAPVR